MCRPIFASLYDRIMAPLETADLSERRRILLSSVSSPVLEIGAGTGANLSHYGSGIKLVASEPEPAMLAQYRGKSGILPHVLLLFSRAEAIPFPAETFETVVSTLVLCSVCDPEVAMHEIHRVLRRDGRLIFIEHIRGEGRRGRWQDRIEFVWSKLSGGCHPNRQTLALIEKAGFHLEELKPFDPSRGSRRLVRWACQPVLPFVSGQARRV